MKKLFRVVTYTYINSICARHINCIRYREAKPTEVLYETNNFFEAADHLECDVNKIIRKYFYYYGDSGVWVVKENKFYSLRVERTYESLEGWNFSLDYLMKELPADEMIEYMKDRGMNCSLREKN